ncbi:hypothetical protein DSM112329_00103 [Paraconexibacter sp. AEG42_29]|uniref:Ferritin-like domain-containing protein n=1 Tax=Paraconexibacter sp. AEG42_29 TaxID=2997339 RepID=A0AAU7ANZ8_9ACTN
MNDVIGRRTLLRTAGAAGLAALTAPAVARAQTAPRGEPATPGDRAILKYMFDAEYIQVALYTHALTLELDPQVAAFARAALARHRVHVRTLRAVNIDADVVVNRSTVFEFGEQDQQGFLLNAKRIENAAAAGAGTAVTLIEDQQRLEPLLVILTDELAHAGSVARLLGEPAAEAGPFDDPQPLAAMRLILTSAN